jgi:hypothetical protein
VDTNDCFLVNLGDQLFVWIGRRATAAEKKNSMLFAQDFLAQHGLPDWTPVERVVEGGETAAFKLVFSHFDPPQKPPDLSRPAGGGAVRAAAKGVDAGALRAAQERDHAIAEMVDDVSGRVSGRRASSANPRSSQPHPHQVD